MSGAGFDRESDLGRVRCDGNRWLLLDHTATGTADWSRAMRIYHEAKKNRVILFDWDTRLWRGYLFGDKSAKLPTKKSFKNPKTGTNRLTYF